MNIDALRTAIKKDEECPLKMYFDTQHIPTIGWGHNLRDKLISQAAADQILEDDLTDCKVEALAALPWLATLDDVRANVLLNMAFNMGIHGLLGFNLTLAYVQGGHYELAAQEMLSSKWAGQVGARAQRLAQEMRTGVA